MSLLNFPHSPPPPPAPRLLRNCSSPPARPTAPYATAASSTARRRPRALVEIEKSKVIACLRATDANVAFEAARAALSSGISVLEITMDTPGVTEIIEGLVKEYPSSIIGAGTVLNTQDARKAVKAGVHFLMSPCTIMEILHDLQYSEVLCIPGAMTPTEVFSAYNYGAGMVKIYPVSIIGGDKYISTLKKPFPEIALVASQGIATDSIRRYIKAGASAVVLSDAIFDKEAMKSRNFKEISRLACLAALQAEEVG